MQLLLHPKTKASVDAFLAHPSHGILITGEEGSGKGTLAKHIVDTLLDSSTTHQFQKIVGQDGAAVTIDMVRDIIRFTQLTIPGKDAYRRSIIIEHAQNLTNEAQNALLKILEEPPANTLIILTATSGTGLLPTVGSRLQTIQVLPVSLTSSLEYFAENQKIPQEITRNYYLSDGNVGLLKALLEQSSDHALSLQITAAKEILKISQFERLALIESIVKQKTNLDLLCLALVRVTNAALLQAIKTKNTKQMLRLKRSLQAAVSTRQQLQYSPNNKLLLTNLMLEL